MSSLDNNEILKIYEARISDLESLLEISKSLSSNLHYSSVLDAILLTCMGRARVLKAGLFNRSYYVSLHLEYDFTIRDLIGFNFPDKENILKQFAVFTFEKLHKKPTLSLSTNFF